MFSFLWLRRQACVQRSNMGFLRCMYMAVALDPDSTTSWPVRVTKRLPLPG
jgi:hypothetical protein